MPISAKFTWSETADTIKFVVAIPFVKPAQCDVIVTARYVRVHQAPHWFDADLAGAIDISSQNNVVQKKSGAGEVTLVLRKKATTAADGACKGPGLWGTFPYNNSISS